ncbi:MAG: glycosyltransferase family 4 protein [Gemmatimonadaceae bacterium]
MRILFVNDGVGDAGGVQHYLEAVAHALRGRGHELALLHVDPLHVATDSPVGAGEAHFGVASLGPIGAVEASVGWRPAVVFSHNMRVLSVERELLLRMPVVKMMHGYFGTCVGGQKMHAWPRAAACDRSFGAACLALYLPRHCGQWSASKLVEQYAWARSQRALFGAYRTIVVASDHMRREYERQGVPSHRVMVNPLFPLELPTSPAPMPDEFRVVFLGRMTALKGGDVLIHAMALASREVGVGLHLTLAGDGPNRQAWQALSASLGLDAVFPGWLEGPERTDLYRGASLVAVPSVWPEPFGLTGLEGGAHGAPAVAFDVGGIDTWLHDGVNGWLVSPRAGAEGLARALVAAFRDRAALRARREGARRVAEEFSLTRHVDALEQILWHAAAREAAS